MLFYTIISLYWLYLIQFQIPLLIGSFLIKGFPKKRLDEMVNMDKEKIQCLIGFEWVRS